MIQYALQNWIIRGVCANRGDRETITYWGFVPGRDEMLRVPVSLDDSEIITAHFDAQAADRLRHEGRPWFQRRCKNLEVRFGDQVLP